MLGKEDPEEWKRLEMWLKKQSKVSNLVGLGGSIRSFLNMHSSKKMSNLDFIQKSSDLSSQSLDDKILNYKLANDRADVIDHALKIYLKIIVGLGIKNIKATKWGVSDSIAVKTFHELYSKKISIYKN